MSIPASILKDIATLDGSKNTNRKEKPQGPRKVGEMAFVYESEPSASGRDAIDPNRLNIVAANATNDDMFAPQAGPVSRKEVMLLKHTMIQLLDEIGAKEPSQYPTEMHLFLDVIQKEQKIYDHVFAEIIRQVSVNMIERGQVLSELRKRYSNMFIKIPRHIHGMHMELVAQRKLNRRLSEELVRARETTNDLLQELEFVRAHDIEATKHAQEAQEKLVTVLTQSDNTDEVLEEYHKLYNMQRSRLEENIRVVEEEKRSWVNAATALAIRIGSDNGAEEFVSLQKKEEVRLRLSTHFIVSLSEANQAELLVIERQIDEWREKLLDISSHVVDEDHKNMERLGKIQREMKMMISNIVANSPMDATTTDHPLLSAFHVYDLKSIVEYHSSWLEQISAMVVRFTSDRDLTVLENIVGIRAMTATWIEGGLKLLARSEKTSNGKDYVPLTHFITQLQTDIEEWLTKMEARVSGDDGTASQIISLQNKIDDKCTALGAKDLEKPLPEPERLVIQKTLEQWIQQIGNLINCYSNTVEKEQNKTPLHVENWVTRVLDLMNTDTDIRNEDNTKIHTSIVSWLVQILVREASGKLAEIDLEGELQILHQDLRSFNSQLLHDSADVEIPSSEKKDLKAELADLTNTWISISKKMIIDLSGKTKLPSTVEHKN